MKTLFKRHICPSALFAGAAFLAVLVILLPSFLTERSSLTLASLLFLAGAAATFSLFLSLTHPTPRASTVFFALCYALSANALVSASEFVSSAAVLFLFPLVMAGVHCVAVYKNGILLAVTLAATLATADVLITLTLLSTLLCFVYYLISDKNVRRMQVIVTFLLSFLGGVLMSLPFLLPALRSLDLSAFFGSSSELPYRSLLAKLFPASFDTVSATGTPFLYCGILPTVFLPAFLGDRKTSLRKRLFPVIALFILLLLSLLPRTMPLFLLLGDLDAFRFPVALPFAFFLPVSGEAGFRRHLKNPTSLSHYTAAIVLLLAFAAEKLMAEPPITAAETARTVMHDPASLFITLLSLALILLAVHLLTAKKRLAGNAVLSVAVVLELFLASLFLLPLVKEECDIYYASASETHTVSYEYADDILADQADEMFYYFRDAASGRLGNAGSFGNVFGESDEDISAFFATFGAKYENGMLTGSTPVLDALLGITYTIGDGSGVQYGLSEHFGETKRQKQIYKNIYTLPVGMSVQTVALDGLPTDADPFCNMNEFLTILSGRSTTVFKTLTPEKQNGVYIYRTDESTVWLYRNECVESVDVKDGKLRIESKGGEVYAATLDAAAAKDILSELYTRSFAPHVLESGHVSGNIFISTEHRLLLTSLPYSADFTVEVDGKEVETRSVSGLLAIPIHELGYHNVSLHFTPLPRAAGKSEYASLGYLAAGIAVTLLPMLAVCTATSVKRRRTRNTEREDTVCKE